MKCLTVLFTLFFSLASINVKAQSKPLPKEQVVPLLCYKWQAIEMVGGTKRMPIPPDGDYTIFKSDFTHEQKEDGTITKGTWKYVESTKKIVFSSGDEYMLKNISATRLELGFTMDGMPVALVFKHFDK